MNKMEYLKQRICSQIMQMDAEALYDFCFLIKECDNERINSFDLCGFLDCKKCEECYSDCRDDKFECEERFKKYCEEPV